MSQFINTPPPKKIPKISKNMKNNRFSDLGASGNFLKNNELFILLKGFGTKNDHFRHANACVAKSSLLKDP